MRAEIGAVRRLRGGGRGGHVGIRSAGGRRPGRDRAHGRGRGACVGSTVIGDGDQRMEGRRRDVGGQQRSEGEQQLAGGAGELVVRDAIVFAIVVVILIAVVLTVVVAVVVTLVVPAAGRRGVRVPGLGH